MTDLFNRARFIMVHPSHPGNVGAAARAIKTMGFRELCLVAPRFDNVTDMPEALALASGATDVLASVQIVDTLAQALAPVTLAFAMTARERVLGPPTCDIREAATLSQQHLLDYREGRVAIVLGTERSGLTNEDIAQCQRICHIPANPEYSSLNVAQALQLAAWELRYALGAFSTDATKTGEGAGLKKDEGAERASNEKIQAFLTHWQEALIEIQFLNLAYPKKLVPRMQHLFSRADLTNDEVDMMRGVCTAMVKAAKGQLRPS
ncbi:MAG: RNA methyltransferase [Pusillimonas sp.]